MRLALLGDPVAHSLSPRIFAAGFAAADIDGTYEARRVDRDGVVAAFADLSRGALDGFNVTMPHKALAASLCDRLDPRAAKAGAVNTVIRENGDTVGYSTDINAFEDCLEALPAEGPVLVLGAGGSAASVLVALSGGRSTVYGASRRFGKFSATAERVGIEGGEVRWGVPVVLALVVNCTPLGMKGEELPGPVLDLSRGLLDLPYASEVTPAVRSMEAQGKPVIAGLDFLLAQANHGFRLFVGRPAPTEAMRQGVEKP